MHWARERASKSTKAFDSAVAIPGQRAGLFPFTPSLSYSRTHLDRAGAEDHTVLLTMARTHAELAG